MMMKTTGGSVLLAVSLLLFGCAAPSPPVAGAWVGDLRLPTGTDRIELSVDSGGRSGKLTIRRWGLQAAPASLSSSPTGGMTMAAAVNNDTVRLDGTLLGAQWSGAARRGSDSATFELRHLYAMSAEEWGTLVGTYRTADGNLVGIAPLTEFGPRPMIVDYKSGRLAPLYPIARDKLLAGHSLITPIFPADTLDLTLASDGSVSAVRFLESGEGTVSAGRLGTRDEAVEFTNGPVTLRGTLTLPVGPPPYPALVLVHGSNALTRDVFGPWTRFFAGHGFAVLAYDKRGTGSSTGDWKQADFPTLAQDVRSGVAFLLGRSDIRHDRVGLWGASQAGWIMPIVAADSSSGVAFMVVHAGTGTTVRQQGILNLQYELRFSGFSDSAIALGSRYRALDDSVTRTGSGLEEQQRFYQAYREKEPWLWEPGPVDAPFRQYYRMLMDFDPAPLWSRIKCPVLLFYGELDANVPPKESWPPIERGLKQGGNTRVTHFVLPQANHLLLEARTGARDEYPGLSAFVPGYFDRMAEWFSNQVR